MTHEQLQREFQYRVAMSLIRELMKSGIISQDDSLILNEKLILRFQSVLAGLYPDTALYNSLSELICDLP